MVDILLFNIFVYYQFNKLTMFKRISLLLVLSLLSFACQEKEESILKIYVRNNSNVLTSNATVRIVGDVDRETPEYFDETESDASGVAYFNLDSLFSTYEKSDNKVAYFTVYAKDTATLFSSGEARGRAELTSTATIIMDE